MEQNSSYKRLLKEDTHYKRNHVLQSFFSNNSTKAEQEKISQMINSTKNQFYTSKNSIDTGQQKSFSQTPFKTQKNHQSQIEINTDNMQQIGNLQVIEDIQKQLQQLRSSMKEEIDHLKQRVQQCEDANQKLIITLKNQIEQNQKQSQSQQQQKTDLETIAEEYKSQKRQINELSCKNTNKQIIVSTKVKDLAKIGTNKTKQTLQALKNEIEINTKKFQNSKSSEKVKTSITKQPVRSPERKITSKSKLQQYQSKSKKECNVEQEFSDFSQKVNRPLETPFRGVKNKEALTFADRIFADSQKQKQKDSRNCNFNFEEKLSIPSIISNSQSPILSNRDHNLLSQNMIINESQLQLGATSIIESPKFLEFVNANTNRKSKPQIHENSLIITQESPIQAKEPFSQEESKYNQIIYQRWLNVANQQKRERDSDQSTEKGEKPSLKNRTIVESKLSLDKNSDSNDSIQEEEEMASEDCDEKRSYTPEPRQAQHFINAHPKNLNRSMIGLQTQNVNSVYQSSKMQLSRYISNNKSHIDYRNTNHVMHFEGKQALIDSKGSKCICKKNQIGQSQQNIPEIKEKRKICGSYCKFLSPQEQKRIMQDCMNKESNSTIKQKPKRYLINAKWWRQWCDYVNFDAYYGITSQNQFYPAEEQLDSKRSSLQTQRQYDSSTMYCKPEKICNQSLFDQQEKGTIQNLREELVEHFDFETLYPSVWLHLYSWYSADISIARYLKRDKINTSSQILDLYPNKSNNNSYIVCHQSESDQEDSNQSLDSSPLRNKQNNMPPTIPTSIKYQNQMNKNNNLFGISLPDRKKLTNKSQDFVLNNSVLNINK